MNRGFNQFGGGFRPPFRPFPHPFFPRRFLFPFFFFSPFFFPFFREDGTREFRDDQYFAHHQAQPGESLHDISHKYNIPSPILEEANPGYSKHMPLQHGASVYIPRISHLYCHKTYIEHNEDEAGANANAVLNTQMNPNANANINPLSNQASPFVQGQGQVTPKPF
ncbi:LysM peptidoglycan-binding domain-containing protein [Paenibacillus sp. NPDC058071]|uniref:LysM peptidoglycan-binding domain-containing protein n=1 Tax=Paenibacillus sp. NPDC058071 TaxID=3346326 RepID=UPI0036DBD897